jgi:hypothetical protein
MDAQDEKQDRIKTVVAVLLAAVTVMGAVVAWRAAVAGDEAGNADFSGLAATLNSEEARALNSITGYEDLRAYTDYVRYNETGNALADALADAPEDEQAALERQMREAWDLATEIQDRFFENRYVNADGTYDLARELDELWADDTLDKDMFPEPHFTRSDRLRAKSTSLVSILIALGAALVLFTLANMLTKAIRYILVAGGTLILLGSVVAVIIIESSA